MEQITEDTKEPVNYRHGEVLLIGMKRFMSEVIDRDLLCRFKKVGRKQVKSGVVAAGKSGNAHIVKGGEVWSGMKYNSDKRSLMVFSDGNAVIQHPEHRDIKLEKGAYEVMLQREMGVDGEMDVED